MEKRTTSAAELCHIIGILYDTVQFYADPDTYFAIGFMFDSPTGEFSEDFEYNDDYRRDMPGKKARQTLDRVYKIMHGEEDGIMS